jgi:hypothetical protein
VDLGRAGDECTAAPATTTPEERRIDDAHDRLPELKRGIPCSYASPTVGKGRPAIWIPEKTGFSKNGDL